MDSMRGFMQVIRLEMSWFAFEMCVSVVSSRLSRKLVSAGWSPFCLSKVLGGLESPIAWNLPLPPITVGMSPLAAKPTASTSSASASLCFHAKVPAKLAFVPYRWAWSCLFMHCVYCNSNSNNNDYYHHHRSLWWLLPTAQVVAKSQKSWN